MVIREDTFVIRANSYIDEHLYSNVTQSGISIPFIGIMCKRYNCIR